MKRKFKIVPRWEPEQRFAVPLYRTVPVARRLQEFLPEDLFHPAEELLRTWTLLR